MGAVAFGQKDIKLIGAFFFIVSRALERFLITYVRYLQKW
jgi:hypothetical protein